MLQRIQTIYLLIALILSAINTFIPVLELGNDNNFYQLTFMGLEKLTTEGYTTIEHSWTLTVFLVIIPIITLITINLFKYRMLQIRLTIFNSLLMIGFYGMLFYFTYYFTEKYSCEVFFEWNIVVPAICLILNYLAIRSIGKDEALVKSLNRIR